MHGVSFKGDSSLFVKYGEMWAAFGVEDFLSQGEVWLLNCRKSWTPNPWFNFIFKEVKTTFIYYSPHSKFVVHFSQQHLRLLYMFMGILLTTPSRTYHTNRYQFRYSDSIQSGIESNKWVLIETAHVVMVCVESAQNRNMTEPCSVVPKTFREMFSVKKFLLTSPFVVQKATETSHGTEH